MAAPRLPVIRAIVIKDLITLWPLAVTSLILPVSIAIYPAIQDVDPGFRFMATGLGVLALTVLTISLFQQDSAIDPRQDWRTRPVSSLNLLLAKGAFLFLVVIVPQYAAAVAAEFVEGHSAGEAFIAGLAELAPIITILALGAAVGIATTTLVQALLTGMAMTAVFLVWMLLTRRAGGATLYGTGLGWMANLFLITVAAAGIAAALWLLYGRRMPGPARSILGIGAVVALINPVAYAGNPAFALQRWLSPAPKAAAPVGMTAAICEAVTPPAASHASKPGTDLSFPSIATTLVPTGLPDGWIVVSDRVRLHYSQEGSAALSLRPPLPVGTAQKNTILPAAQYWMVTRDARTLLASGETSLRIDADMTLMKPAETATLVVDAPRRHFPGLGYCSAKTGKGAAVKVDCFLPGSQPATIVATAPSGDRLRGQVSYGPDALFGASYRIHIPAEKMALPAPGDGGPVSTAPMERTLRITAFEAVAHTVRSVDLDPAKAQSGPLCPKRPNLPVR